MATGLTGTGLATMGRGAAEVAVVLRLFVAPAARGQGLARALLHAAWAEARALGRRAVLDVHTASAAIGLYEAEGWARRATMDAPWRGPDGPSPRMHVYLAPA
ncbi:GNAT family N-acetyltransferase [Deinococcus petrolearius]|uniref:GNAT family N-acetyltransferase n=1 Tax=Deinococcus petrolearius TaxID=1751295 RepID=A0ABW1DFC5_9DEIO